MLTFAEYKILWVEALKLNNAEHSLPCYYQYLQREVYFQDYLDLFGAVHGPTYPRVLHEGNYYVSLPALAPDPTGVYAEIITGVVHLRVDYDFPFTGSLKVGRRIKYVLVGEAAPAPGVPQIVKDSDKNNSFFYNVRHVNTSRYLDAPVSAFGIIAKSKDDRIIELAEAGFILLDLFPFAMSYSTELRKEIQYNVFWDRLCEFLCKLKGAGKVDDEPCLGFAGPAALHHRIANSLFGSVPSIAMPSCLAVKVKSANNELCKGSLPSGDLKPFLRTWSSLKEVSFDVNDNPNWKVKVNKEKKISLPIFSCECWDSSFQGPNSVFIKVAFDLP